MVNPRNPLATTTLSDLADLADDTVAWVEARLIHTPQGATLPKAHALCLAQRLDRLTNPSHVPPNSQKPLLVRVSFNEWAVELHDGNAALTDALAPEDGALWGKPLNERIATRLSSDPNAVAGVLTALRLMESGLREMAGGPSVASQSKGRGRPPGTDPDRDRRWAGAWESGRYRTKADCAQALETDERDLKLALDRERKRRKK